MPFGTSWHTLLDECDALDDEAAAFDEWETPVLINLYTLLSDIQRNAGDLRTEVREVLLDRIHHDHPVHG